MVENAWSSAKQDKPPVSWNPQTKTFHIILTGIDTAPNASNGIEAQWTPPITSVVRIREAGTEDWLLGIETPLTACSFIDLKPDTEYEIELRHKNAYGEGEPATVRTRTDSKGKLGAL